MEKKIMYISVAVIAILLIAGIGAVVLLSNNNNNSNSSANVKILLIKTTDNSTAYSPLDEAAVLEHVNNTKAGGYDLANTCICILTESRPELPGPGSIG